MSYVSWRIDTAAVETIGSSKAQLRTQNTGWISLEFLQRLDRRYRSDANHEEIRQPPVSRESGLGQVWHAIETSGAGDGVGHGRVQAFALP